MKKIILVLMLFFVGCENEITPTLIPTNGFNGNRLQEVLQVCIEGHIYYQQYGPKLDDEGKPCHCDSTKN